MKNIVLQRKIAVRCWNVLGTVARASKRPELMPVLLRARERSQTTAEDVAEHLFFEQRSRRVVAERMLRIAAAYGLLAENERRFSLTGAGLAALTSQQVFVPERGSWTIWASNDPLLGFPVLRVDRWSEPTAFDELRGNNKEVEREFVTVPRTLRGAVGRVASLPSADGGHLRIDELDDKAETVEAEDDVKVVWNVGESKLRLDGSLRGARVNTVLDAPNITPEDAWQQLLESANLWPRWDRARNALLVGFEETKERERESLLRDLVIDAPSIGDVGEFDAVTIQDVPLAARTPTDAGHWAAWRLQTRLRDYATSERFAEWAKEATARSWRAMRGLGAASAHPRSPGTSPPLKTGACDDDEQHSVEEGLRRGRGPATREATVGVAGDEQDQRAAHRARA